MSHCDGARNVNVNVSIVAAFMSASGVSGDDASKQTSAAITLRVPPPWLSGIPRCDEMLKLILPVAMEGIGAFTTEMVSPPENQERGHALHNDIEPSIGSSKSLSICRYMSRL